MWEFLQRQKKVPAVSTEPAPASEETKNETTPVFEESSEQATEKVNEKYAAILSTSAAPVSTQPIAAEVHSDAAVVNQATDAQSRVNQLVELAQVKGVAHAVEVAKKMNDLYVLDTMHDELADKFYEALKAKGLVLGE